MIFSETTQNCLVYNFEDYQCILVMLDNYSSK